MNSKRSAPRARRASEPARPLRRGIPRGILAGAAAIVAVIVLYVYLTRDHGPPVAPTPPDWPKVTVNGADLPVYVAATRARREGLVPLQLDPDRALARFFRRYSAPVGVLFAYPDTAFRSVHLDEVRSGGAVTIIFLTDDGGIDSIWSVGDNEFLALSRGRVRYTLFVPGAWCDARGISEKDRIGLPPEAATAAARAEIENPPITDPPPARIKVGGADLEVEVAVRLEPRSRGLMFREYLADGKGMIFLFPQPQEQKFWMRNTRIPLDIAYIGEDYRIRNIVPMRPHDLDHDRKYRSDGPVIIVLETPAGWFRRNRVRKGARLEVSAALREMQQKADP